MVDPQSSRFWRAAVQSGLADPAALQVCWDALPPDKRTLDAVDRRLARQAVNSGLVTVWQAQQLLSGRATGFAIDRYVLLNLIGQGGMGRVYLARDTRLSRKVALKVLSKERMTNSRAIARFQREGKVGAQLQHENLVRIYDEGESSGIRYLVMEYIEGKNVAQMIAEQGALPWPLAARLGRQVAMGLEHAQRKGLIHRDVNPSNILVTADGTAKLTDLGLAIDLGDEDNVTRDGATVGTFDYISPEQAKHSREVDTRADIYSLGCSLYHMIAGRVPFPTPSLPEKLYAHQLHEADPLASHVEGVPEGLAGVIRAMMRKSPDERPATPALVAGALAPYIDDPDPAPSRSSSSMVVGEVGSAGPKTRVAAPVVVGGASVVPALAVVPASTIGTSAPVETAGGSDSDLAIFAVDIGPETPLSEALSGGGRGRSKSRSRSGVVRGGEESSRRLARSSTPALLAFGLVVVLAGLVGISAVVVASRNKLRGNPAGVEPAAKPAGPIEYTNRVDPLNLPTISVVTRDGARGYDTLESAALTAIGNGGEVVLNPPGGVLKLSMVQTPEIPVHHNSLTIRAAVGSSPVLEINADAPSSLFVSSPGATITLRGLRVVVHYRAAQNRQPLINSGGTLVLDRCAFVADGEAGGSRVALIQGTKLRVDDCLFAGFDRAFDVDSYPGSDLAIRRTMIVHSNGGDRSPGWAVRVNHAGPVGGKNPRRVAFERCTIRGGGLLEVAAFSAASPLTVALDRSAIQARSLVAWTPRPKESPDGWKGGGLKWSGKGNRYDITGSTWVVLSAGGDLPMPGSPTDLDGWAKAIGSDADSTGRSFKFAASPAEASTDPSAIVPARFAIEGLEGVGADPRRVGPATSGDGP